MEEIKEVYRLKKINKNLWALENKIKAHFIDPNGASTKTVICVPLDKKTGRPKDFLSKEEKKILSKNLGIKEEDLEPGSEWLTDHPFIYEGTEVVLDPENPLDQLNIAIIKANSSKVAFGDEELSKKANAEFILYNEQEKYKKQAKKANRKAEAYKLFAEMSPEEKRGILIVLGKKVSNASNESIDALIDQEITNNPDVIVTLYNDPSFKEIVFVQSCIVYGLLKKGREGITDKSSNEFLGSDINQAINFLKDPENKLLADALRRELINAKK